MGLLRTLLLGDVGNYLDNQDLKREHDRVRKKLNRKASIDKEQDKAIQELERENIELKYALSALVKLLEKKGVINEDELKGISEIESEIENADENFEPEEAWSGIWSKKFKD